MLTFVNEEIVPDNRGHAEHDAVDELHWFHRDQTQQRRRAPAPTVQSGHFSHWFEFEFGAQTKDTRTDWCQQHLLKTIFEKSLLLLLLEQVLAS